ncbi:nitrogenase iron-molybdenum cofactor biosynthesis protein NifN [Magnetospira thiophila]
MAEIVKRKKALSVNPLKSSQTIGAALAFLGLARSLPMLHGSQGCTAFGKVFFVRHFREPIPLQTTAIDQISAVMGTDDSVVEGLKTICENSRPAIIGLPTTGLVETEGTDVTLAVRTFRDKYPEYADVVVVPVSTPDFTGCLETGFAAALSALFEAVLPAQPQGLVGRRPRQVNLLVNATLTPGDVEELKVLVEAFDLRPVVVPDLSDSLDGHLPENDFNPLTTGGTPMDDLRTLGEAAATIVVGASLSKPADVLAARTGVPDHRFDHLMTLAEMDRLVMTLGEIAGRDVPVRIDRQRSRLQDAMLDCHFSIGFSKIAVAGDPDLLNGFAHLLTSMGAEVVAAVSPTNAPVFARIPTAMVKIGDLEDLHNLALEQGAELIIGNSHTVATAERLNRPLLRAGFPQYDWIGGFARTWIGYPGIRQSLFDIANLLLSREPGHVAPHRSIYAQENVHAPGSASENPGRPH